MNKRSWILASLAALLAITYLVFFSGAFAAKEIKIIAVLRQERPGRPNAKKPVSTGVYPVAFGLDRAYALTSVKVFAATDLQFSGNAAQPIWSVVPADPAKLEKIEGFRYGGVKGMKPADPAKPAAEPLLPDGVYRIVVEAGSIKGERDFKAVAIPKKE